jgi:hypothetical protein
MGKHELHIALGNAFKDILELKKDYKVELDEACETDPDKKKHLPFFLSDVAHNDTEITNVDLMVVKDKTVKVICEIEESDITPIRTYGKVFTTATTLMCQLNDKTRYKLDKNGIFIQVLSSEKLKDYSKKEKQGENIENAINNLLKSSCSWVKEYHLIYGKIDDFEDTIFPQLKVILTIAKVSSLQYSKRFCLVLSIS